MLWNEVKVKTSRNKRIGTASPFTFTINFVLRERDILVINSNPNIESNLPQIFISRPLQKRKDAEQNHRSICTRGIL
jgi:hypothetical protein